MHTNKTMKLAVVTFLGISLAAAGTAVAGRGSSPAAISRAIASGSSDAIKAELERAEHLVCFSCIDMHLPDAPMLATLLGANLRHGRNVDAMDKAVALKVYEELPPASQQPAGSPVYISRNSLGQASFESDKSLKVFLPAGKPLILEFVDGSGSPVLTMSEEHQVSPNEYITPGVSRNLFNNVCGGCHGSKSGDELDIAVSADALTGASVSLSRNPGPKNLQ